MEKNTRTKNILLIVLLVAVLTLSISYAFLSQTLTITNMTATVKGGGWNVKFTSATCSGNGLVDNVVSFNQGLVTYNNAVDLLENMSADFHAPGDSVDCEITVTNKGSIDAVLTSFTLGGSNLDVHSTIRDAQGFDPDDPSQASAVATATADENIVQNALTYTLVYGDDDRYGGLNVVPGDTTFTLDSADSSYADAHSIPAGQSRTFLLTIAFPNTAQAQTLPSNDVKVSGFNAVFVYRQA